MLKLINKIKNNLVSTDNKNLIPINSKENKETRKLSPDIDISYKYDYNKRKDEYIVYMTFNKVPKYVLYKYENDLVFITDNTIHIRRYEPYSCGWLINSTGYQLVYKESIPIGGTIKFNKERLYHCEKFVKDILNIFRNMREDAYNEKLKYEIFLTDKKLLNFHNIALFSEYDLSDSLMYITEHRVKEIIRTETSFNKRTYGRITDSWMSGMVHEKTEVSIDTFLNKYKKNKNIYQSCE